MEKRNAVFYLQCYAIERHFQGTEYKSLTSALFVSTSRLNQWGKGFYCVTLYPQKSVSAKTAFQVRYMAALHFQLPILDLPTLDYPTLEKPT